MNAVLALKAQLAQDSRRPYLARGARVERCAQCCLPPRLCLCLYRPTLRSRLQFGLLMHHNEPFKPSNTGKLICDVLPGTAAFEWHRTEPAAGLEQWFSTGNTRIVFPRHYVAAQRLAPLPETGPVKLLILDGTWQQARKMLRTSRYLDALPVTSIDEPLLSAYQLRQQYRDGHLCTAEVAALLLQQAGETANSTLLSAWLQTFSEHYLAAKRQRLPLARALTHLQALMVMTEAESPDC